ncbi:hypothetical protein SGPA1_12669 [Streptomyces misionensis JCM 4497]
MRNCAAPLHSSENDESPRSHAPQALYCKGNQTATCGEPSTQAAESNRGQDHFTRMFERGTPFDGGAGLCTVPGGV